MFPSSKARSNDSSPPASPKEALLNDVTAIDSVRHDYCIDREAANGNTQLSLFLAALRNLTA